MRWVLVAWVVLEGAATRPGDAQAELQARLEEERAALHALKGGKKDLLGVIDSLERAARAQAARAAALEKQVRGAQGRVAAARGAEDRARADERAFAGSIGPRLVTLYRLTRQGRLSSLTSASDFAALVRKERAVSTLVQTDLDALEQLAALGRHRARRAEAAETLQTVATDLSQELRLEQELARARRANLQDTIADLGKEEGRMQKLVRELEEQDRELSQLVRDIESEGGQSSLKSRKGKLPFPTRGTVEVGFGKVVNPRFNTVTVQKGVDVRAPLGEKVHAVAPGTVVFSDWLKGYGNLVIVDHGGAWHSLYAHLAHSEVEVGNEVEEGEDIGAVGDTGSLKGSYLYFELRRKGDAIDPLPWFDPEGL